MFVIAYFSVTIVVCLLIVNICTRYLKISFLLKSFFFFGILVIIVFILPRISTLFRFDLVYGGDHLYSRSSTKSESIKRGVFLCDLKLVGEPLNLNDSMSIKAKEAWVEKDWAQGYWFWTTLQGIYGKCNVIVCPENVKGNWYIYRGVNQEYLGYYEDENLFVGRLDELPKSDTLIYYVLKERQMDFSNSDIIGEIKFVLLKRK